MRRKRITTKRNIIRRRRRGTRVKEGTTNQDNDKSNDNKENI